MKISVIVPAFNEEKVLARSLGAITSAAEAFRANGWEWELIVCDNNSTDRTAEIAKGAGAKVVFERINQISRARNAGGFAAQGDWLVFVDADSFPSAELFGRVAEHIESGKYGGGGCVVKLDERMREADVLVWLWNTLSRCLKWAAGSFIFCEARLFREINGFSEKLFASEEVDFSRRLKKAVRKTGRKLVIIRDFPMVTSARKIHLYSRREHARFMLKAVLFPRRVISSREECHPWYDGRR